MPGENIFGSGKACANTFGRGWENTASIGVDELCNGISPGAKKSARSALEKTSGYPQLCWQAADKASTGNLQTGTAGPSRFNVQFKTK